MSYSLLYPKPLRLLLGSEIVSFIKSPYILACAGFMLFSNADLDVYFNILL